MAKAFFRDVFVVHVVVVFMFLAIVIIANVIQPQNAPNTVLTTPTEE